MPVLPVTRGRESGEPDPVSPHQPSPPQSDWRSADRVGVGSLEGTGGSQEAGKRDKVFLRRAFLTTSFALVLGVRESPNPVLAPETLTLGTPTRETWAASWRRSRALRRAAE